MKRAGGGQMLTSGLAEEGRRVNGGEEEEGGRGEVRMVKSELAGGGGWQRNGLLGGRHLRQLCRRQPKRESRQGRRRW